MATADKEWIFSELQTSINNLAIDNKNDLYQVIGEESLDELALDFDNILKAATPFLEGNDEHGLKLLNAIDEHLIKISGVENTKLWSEDAFFTDIEWKSIKEKAQLALKHFSWS